MEMATVEKGAVQLARDPFDPADWVRRNVESALPSVERLDGRLVAVVPERASARNTWGTSPTSTAS